MKRIIVYFVLSIILIIPIVSIVLILYLQNPAIELTTTYSAYDYSALENEKPYLINIEEVIISDLVFDSSNVFSYEIYIGNNEFLSLVNNDSYIDLDTDLYYLKGEIYKSKKTGKILSQIRTGNKVIFIMKSSEVEIAYTYLPLETIDSIKNSHITFNIRNKEYSGQYLSHDLTFDKINNGYKVVFSVDNINVPLDSGIKAKIFTGKVENDALVVRNDCIFVNNDGSYYVKELINKDLKTYEVKLGLSGDNVVQILSENVSEDSILIIDSSNGYNTKKVDYD